MHPKNRIISSETLARKETALRESQFQAQLIRDLRNAGCQVLKNDSGYLQGVPDLMVLYDDRWAMLEVKRDAQSPVQPNQKYYVDILDQMSFAAFIHPGNKETVLNDMWKHFRAQS